MKRRELLALAMAGVSAQAFAPLRAFAQTGYPDRPIKLVVPFAPGGVVDTVGRLWGEKVKPTLGQKFLIVLLVGNGKIMHGLGILAEQSVGFRQRSRRKRVGRIKLLLDSQHALEHAVRSSRGIPLCRGIGNCQPVIVVQQFGVFAQLLEIVGIIARAQVEVFQIKVRRVEIRLAFFHLLQQRERLRIFSC